jgi:hypothetical protein
MTSPRRFPPPWQVEQTPGGFKVLDASGPGEPHLPHYVVELGDATHRLRHGCAVALPFSPALLPGFFFQSA